MSDFKTQVENITETVTDTSALNDWLKMALGILLIE